MNKVIKIIILLLLMYVLPLLGKPQLIFHLQILNLMLAAAVLFATQPEVSLQEAREKVVTDQNSYYAIIFGGIACQVISVVVWAYFTDIDLTPTRWKWVAIGFILIVVGLMFRIWAIQTLGQHFTGTVQTSEEHELITGGPYALVRHPSYLGSYLAIIGSGAFLHTAVGFVAAAAIMYWAYEMRIRVEEVALEARFGEAYKQYKAKTFRMIPFIW